MKNVDVAVIYTDGSHLTSPLGTGAGIHGYLFNREAIEDGRVYRHPSIPEGITTSGYRQINKDEKLPPLPETVEFIDGVVPVPKMSHSDVAELVAFLTVFEHAPFVAKNYVIYIDASYVVNTYNDWIDGWAARGWRRADGTPIANLELIQRMWEVKQRLKKEGKGVRVLKIKGHSGRYGNERADELARKGSSISARGDGLDYTPYWSKDEMPEEEQQPEVVGEGVNLSAFPDICVTKFCYPMVNEPHPTVTVNGNKLYYMFGGNHAKQKDDIVFVGKYIPDAQFCVMFTKEPWDNVYELVNTHSAKAWEGVPRLRQFDPIAVVFNLFVKRKKFAEAAANGIPIERMHFSEDKNLWMFEDLSITRILRPALLSYRCITIRDELAGWLRDAMEGKNSVVMNDITDLLYDEKGKPKKDFYRNVDKGFDVTIHIPGSKNKVKTILTRGIDIPTRTEINRMKEPEGRFYVAVRRPERQYIEYALVYIGEKYHGLWCGYYSNKRILTDKELEC